jgi:hypothetical protein
MVVCACLIAWLTLRREEEGDNDSVLNSHHALTPRRCLPPRLNNLPGAEWLGACKYAQSLTSPGLTWHLLTGRGGLSLRSGGLEIFLTEFTKSNYPSNGPFVPCLILHGWAILSLLGPEREPARRLCSECMHHCRCVCTTSLARLVADIA